MKLLRYGPPGREKPGLLHADGTVRSLADLLPDIEPRSLQPASIARIRELDVELLPIVATPVRLGPCVAGTRNFLAVGLNYAEHAAESGATPPQEPIIFNKAPSCISGPNDDITIPVGATKVDWEIELAVVIGAPALYVPKERAMSHVAGLCICNDVSERSFQLERGGQWAKGKGCPSFGPLGPWLVTPDEVDDVQSLDMRLTVNGALRQSGNTRTMIFSVRDIVSYLSHFMRLEPGDVITTGTPPGVGLGMKPPQYLKAGDVVALEIAGLGRQQQSVVGY